MIYTGEKNMKILFILKKIVLTITIIIPIIKGLIAIWKNDEAKK